MSALLKRDPRGRFIWRGTALRVWLPELMEAAFRDPVAVTLGEVANFCDRRAASLLRQAATACEPDAPEWMAEPSAYITRANRWMRKAEAVREAKDEVSE